MTFWLTGDACDAECSLVLQDCSLDPGRQLSHSMGGSLGSPDALRKPQVGTSSHHPGHAKKPRLAGTAVQDNQPVMLSDM